MASSYAKNAIVLGLLAAIGPFAIDMYLPALPTIAADLHASTAATQMTLMAFFVAFGLCQIAYSAAKLLFGRLLCCERFPDFALEVRRRIASL